MAQDWGHGRGGIVTREVEIGAEQRVPDRLTGSNHRPGKQAP